jgi:polyribonucleotide nucleotidyltransferase
MHRYHDKVRRFVEREQRNLPIHEVPVQVFVGNQRQQQARREMPHGVSLQGPSNSVQSLQEKLVAFLTQERKDELERGYTTSCDFPQQYIKNLIGTHGNNINKLREEFDCEIQANDGKVDIRGPKAKADAARAHIMGLLKKLQDETTHELNIPAKYHRELIGSKGAHVNRLQDRYGVRINFPRSSSATDDDTAGGAESASSSRQVRSQGPDKVIVKGPSNGANNAKAEIEQLLKYLMENSHTATVSVAQSQIPSIIGSGGRELEAFRRDTNTEVDVPGAQSGSDQSGRVDITIKGTKDNVGRAKRLLEEKAKKFDNTITRTIDVDKKYHRALIGRAGEYTCVSKVELHRANCFFF